MYTTLKSNGTVTPIRDWDRQIIYNFSIKLAKCLQEEPEQCKVVDHYRPEFFSGLIFTTAQGFTVKSPESHLARSHVARNLSHVARNFSYVARKKKSSPKKQILKRLEFQTVNRQQRWKIFITEALFVSDNTMKILKALFVPNNKGKRCSFSTTKCSIVRLVCNRFLLTGVS